MGVCAEFGGARLFFNALVTSNLAVRAPDLQPGGEAPRCGVVKAAEQLEPIDDCAAFEDLGVSEAELFGEVFWGKVVIGFAGNGFRAGIP